MQKRVILSFAATLAIFAVAGLSLVRAEMTAAEDSPYTLTIILSGGAEVPGPGDSDGSGMAELKLNLDTGEVCYSITTENIAPPTAAHIHAGGEGKSGGPKVTFNKAEDGTFKGCVNADKALVNEIKANPAHYYVNVHTAEFPNGAIRGQLGK